MMDELRARRCKIVREIVINPLFNEAFDNIRNDISNELLNTKKEQKDKREELYMEYLLLERFRGRLMSLANEWSAIDMEKSSGEQRI